VICLRGIIVIVNLERWLCKVAERKPKIVKKAKEDNKKLKVSKSSKKEPQTMEELLSLYGAKFTSIGVGNKIKGIVKEKSKGKLILDIGAKTEGLVAERAYKEAEDYIKTLSLGDEVEGTVLVPETPDGYTILSLRHSAEDALWKKIEKAKEDLTPLEVEVKGVVGSGLTVTFLGLMGFVPLTQLGKEAAKNPQGLIGKKIMVAVIDFDREFKKVVFSEKEVSEKQELDRIRNVIKDLKVGDIFEGEVTTIYDFGCFVKIQVGKGEKKVPIEGLVHVSELGWSKIEKVSNVMNVGDKVKVRLIGKRDGKLAFSIKQTQEDPWDKIKEKYEKEKEYQGRVVKVSDFGVFVALEPGVEGLVHITKIPPDRKLQKGEEIRVYVEDIDDKTKKLSLGLVLTAKPVGYK